MDRIFIFFKDKNSIQFSDNFFIIGRIAHRILENYPTKDRIFIQKKHLHLCYFPNFSIFLDNMNKYILGSIVSQNSGYYPTKDKKAIGKLDRIFIFEKIKKLSIAHGQGYSHPIITQMVLKPPQCYEGSEYVLMANNIH